MSEDEVVFTVKDPRGWTVSCTKECWEKHVLVQHPTMKDRLSDVKKAITVPTLNLIFADKDFADRQLYYGKERDQKFYTKVVVRFPKGSQHGSVITAFQTSNTRKGDPLIWPTSTP